MTVSVERVRDVLYYDQQTGLFTWKVMLSPRGLAGTQAGYKTNYGYISIRVDKERHLAHRLAWLYMTGEWPENDIDHINLIRSDNRWSNLQAATRSQNKSNTRAPCTNTSGVKGVSFRKSTGKWRAVIKVNGKQRELGTYAEIDDAQRAYEVAAKEAFGKFARTS